MIRPKQQSAAKIEVSELSADAQLQASIKKLARLRSNLKALQVEISEKILSGVSGLPRSLSSETITVVGELNAALSEQNK